MHKLIQDIRIKNSPIKKLRLTFKKIEELFFVQSFKSYLALSLILLIFLFLSYKTYRTEKYVAEYKIDFNTKNFLNTQIPLYIKEEANSVKFEKFITYQDSNISAQIAGSPLSFVFQPEEFSLNKKITFSATMKNDSDWEISLVCLECASDKKYSWQAFSSNWFKEYKKIAEFPETNIYTRNENNNFKKADSLEEWVNKNLTKKTNIKVINNKVPSTLFINRNIDFVSDSSTVIDNNFRGPHNFYIYLDDTLDLQVVKKDMNIYEGSDEVAVSLYDLNNNLLYSEILADDGIDTANKNFAPVINRHLGYQSLQPGVYRLSFEEGNSSLPFSDWSITYLRINTNKIILDGKKPVLFLEPTTLYTRIDKEKKIYINIWYEQQAQTTNFISSSKSFSYQSTQNDIGKNIGVPLGDGEYQISFTGNQRITGEFFALKPENYFDLYRFYFSDDDADYIFADFKYSQEEDGFVKVSKTFETDELRKTSDAKNINFSIRSNTLNKQFKEENTLYQKGYRLISTYKNYKLFSDNKALEVPKEAKLPISLIAWLKNTIPPNSTLENDTGDMFDYIGQKELEKSSITVISSGAKRVGYILTKSNETDWTEIKNIEINVQ